MPEIYNFSRTYFTIYMLSKLALKHVKVFSPLP